VVFLIIHVVIQSDLDYNYLEISEMDYKETRLDKGRIQ